MNKKIILACFLTLFLSGVFLFFSVVKAEEKKSPAENSLCWTRKQCIEQRKGLPDPEGGFLPDEECKGNAVDDTKKPDYDWGKCLAGAVTTAQVSFGGEEYKKFNSIGDYIKVVYNYALVILSILASVMIIVAGIQYVGSAGSQEMISSAKKRISGAVIGLVLAYMSYTILNMINPATVNLRLPQIYMIRPAVLANWCSSVDKPEEVTVDFVQLDKSFQVFQEAYKLQKIREMNKLSKAHETKEKSHTKCGAEYNFFLGGASGKCLGSSCDGRIIKDESVLLTCNSDDGTMCICIKSDENDTGFACKRGLLGGSLFVYENSKEIYADDIWLYPVCTKNGKNYLDYKTNNSSNLVEYSSMADLNKSSKNYIFGVNTGDINNFCKSTEGSLKGYLIVVEIHDDGGSLDDRFLVTANNCGNDFSPKVGSEKLNSSKGALQSVNSYIAGVYFDKKDAYYNQALMIFKSNESDLKKLSDIIQDNTNIIIPGQNGTFSCSININQTIETKMKDVSGGVFESKLIFW